MSVENLNPHYSMNNPASVYDEEALTALELVGRLANKIVEVIKLVNENELTIDEAKKYLVDNLPDNVEKAVENLEKSGELETLLVKAVSNGKVDKNGLEQITYEMLSQSVKEMFTGGNTPVVGEGAVSTSNVVDGAITEQKLAKSIIAPTFYSADYRAYHTPMVIFDTDNKTATINPEYIYSARLLCREQNYDIDVNTLTVDVSSWTINNIELYYNPTTNVLKVVNALTIATALRQYIYLGCVYGHSYVNTVIIPVTFGGRFYHGGDKIVHNHLPLTAMKPVLFTDNYMSMKASNSYFDFDFSTGKLTFTRTSKDSFHVEGKSYQIDFSTATYEVVNFSATAGHYGLYYNYIQNKFYLSPHNSTTWLGWNNCFYFGLICKPDNNNLSTCIFPHTVNGEYYIHPEKKTRPEAKMMIYNSSNWGNFTSAKIDYDNECMIIPSKSVLYYVIGREYIQVSGLDNSADIVIPFYPNSNYQYLVGGANGLKFINSTLLTDEAEVCKLDSLYYFGFVHKVNRIAEVNFVANKALNVSILGDSISTFDGYCPSGNTTYYNGTQGEIQTAHKTWWGRVLDRTGHKLCVNNSWSGSEIVNTTNTGALHRSSLLHTETETPDIVLIYMGSNDWKNGRTPDNFRSSYDAVIKNIQSKYPEARIYPMTLPYFVRNRGDDVTIEDFNEIIRDVARKNHTDVIETAYCGFHPHSGQKYCLDYNESSGQFLHPNVYGMNVIAKTVIKKLLNSEEVEYQ